MPRSLEIPRFSRILPPALILFGGLAAAPMIGAPGDSARRPDSYLLRDGNSMTISNMDIGENGILLEKLSGDFLWFRRGGTTGLIVDTVTLQQARALFEPLRALEPEQEDLRRREEALEEKEQQLDEREEAIDLRMDRASEQDEDNDDSDDGEESADTVSPLSDADRQAIETELAQLRDRQRELQIQSHELDRIERALDRREDAIEREAEAKLWTLIDASVEKGVAKPSPKSSR
jgi:hypothetical protein